MAKYVLELFLGILSLLLFSFIGVIVQNYVYIIIHKLPLNKQKIPLLVANFINYLIIVLGMLSFVSSLGINLKNFIAGIGITGFVLGIALRDVLSSIASGILIILDDNIAIGDIISYKEINGVVLDINLRYIVLQDYIDNKRHFISNNKLLLEHFSIYKSYINFSLHKKKHHSNL